MSPKDKSSLDFREAFITTAVVLGWFWSNALVGVVNKSLFQSESLQFPILLASLHMLSSFIFGQVLLSPSNRQNSLLNIPRSLWIKILALSVVFSLSIALGNVALQYIGLPLMQMISSLTPVATFFLEMILMPHKFSSKYTPFCWYSMAGLLGGAILSTIGDIDFVPFGFICAVMSTLLHSFKSLLQEYLLKGECVETTIYLLYLMSFPSFLILFVLGFFLEHHIMLELWQLHVPHPKTISLVILSCLSAFGYNIFGFLVSIQASAVTIHILGNIRVVLCIAVSLIVFGNNVTVLSWVGVIMTLLGGASFWYGKKK